MNVQIQSLLRREHTFRRKLIGKTKRSIAATTVIDKSANTHSNVHCATQAKTPTPLIDSTYIGYGLFVSPVLQRAFPPPETISRRCSRAFGFFFRAFQDLRSEFRGVFQSLMSYRLDDPQKAKSPSRSMPTGALFQKADHRLPSTM